MASWPDRAFYRLVYPIVCRPVLRVGDGSFPILDLSEAGIRFRVDDRFDWRVGAVFTGEIILHTAGRVEVKGEVVRLQGTELGARLIKGVPFSVMMEEQRYLTRRFTGRG
jgi:hypothetical protein